MISFVYLDVGGVVIQDLSGDTEWTEFKRELGITVDIDLEFEKWFTEKENLLCIGKESFDLDFKGIKLTMNAFVNKFKKNESIWPVILEIHKHCRVGLLSNAYPNMLNEIKNRGLFPDVDWDIVIDSSVEGYQKPDPKIFEIAQTKAGVAANEILFVENTPRHIKIAQSLSWQTFLYNSSSLDVSSKDLAGFFDKHHE